MNHDDPIESVYTFPCGKPLPFGGMERKQNRNAVAGGLGVWGARHIPSVAISMCGPPASLCFASPWLQVCVVASWPVPLVHVPLSRCHSTPGCGSATEW